MKLRILNMVGIPVVIDIDGYKTVKDLKVEVKNTLSLRICEQILMFRGITLGHSKQLDSYGIVDGSDIKLCIHLRSEEMTISLALEGMDPFEILVLSKASLLNLKRHIKAQCQLFPDEQIWVFQGHELEGDEPIWRYGVEDKDQIQIFRRLVTKITIYAKVNEHEALEVVVPGDVSIRMLKDEISRSISSDINGYEMFFEERHLDDKSTCEMCGMVDGSKMDLRPPPITETKITIYAKVKEHEALKVVVPDDDSIMMLKDEISRLISSKINGYEVWFKEKYLDDKSTCEMCGMVDGSRVVLRPPPIAETKVTINANGISSDINGYEVFFEERHLDDKSTCEMSGIVDGSRVEHRNISIVSLGVIAIAIVPAVAVIVKLGLGL